MIPIVLILAAALSATFHPATPTVGDPITIDVQLQPDQRLALDPAADYELLSQTGSRLVVRTFSPKPFALNGKVISPRGTFTFRNLAVPVRSVLAPGDKLVPAPLRPPISDPASRVPYVAIALAALAAAAAWFFAMRRTRAGEIAIPSAPTLPPLERFRGELAALRAGAAQPWARLADATRIYVAASMPELGTELTTSELLRILDAHADANAFPSSVVEPRRVRDSIAAILRQGDLEKFSPWGAQPADLDTALRRAEELTAAFERPIVDVVATAVRPNDDAEHAA
jgi:hypothetical protein